MATGYHIRRGYNSNHGVEAVESVLREVVSEICREPELIVEEVKRVEGWYDLSPLRFAELYREPWVDLTIRFIEDEDGLMLLQMASGGGREREYKEKLRRAVCRMVIEKMHSVGMEISISVS